MNLADALRGTLAALALVAAAAWNPWLALALAVPAAAALAWQVRRLQREQRRLLRRQAAGASTVAGEMASGHAGPGFGGLPGLGGRLADRVDGRHGRRAGDTMHAPLDTPQSFTDRLFQVSPVPMLVKDADGHILRANQAWGELTGIAPDRAVGRTLGQLYPAQLAAPHEVQEQMAMNAGHAASYEEQLLDSDGLPREVVIRVMPFHGADDAVAGVIVCLVDVSEFREAEVRTNEARDAALRANAAKTEFLANISHELRTPLQTILGFSELGLKRATLGTPQHTMFDDIHRAGRRMLALVNDLLDLSRMDSSVGDIQLQPQDIVPTLEAVVHELRQLAASRGIALETPPPSTSALPTGAAAPGLWAQADAARLAQVLRNVLANAIRFAPTATAVRIRWQFDAKSGQHMIRVADRGPGIPDDEIDSIFEAFVQSSRTKNGAGGTGLGLAICRKIMAAHRGSIRARNRSGGGAEFAIRLPAIAPPVGAASLSAAGGDRPVAAP